MRHDNRRDVLQVVELDDLVIDRRRDDGIEARCRIVEQTWLASRLLEDLAR
jgi:hypothetical protein